MPEQSTPAGAVFISYCSQDAEAAGRICEVLRAAGIEVWLDQSTLRAGDAWDAQIRKQIHDCALFLPVISAHTNARSEGYFRREWKLATRRLLDIADDAAFLVPVVVDESREADARVPEEFLSAQWARLPGGQTPPAFAERVRSLLAGTGAINQRTLSVSSIESSTKQRLRVGRPLLVIVLLVLAGGVIWYYQGMIKVPSARPEHASVPTVATAPDAKSIAVLPFTDMSAEKNQEYMSDGIAEEILSLLTQIPELKVIARTSSFAFKGEKIEIAEIAKKLNVAHVVEGSVRKSGDRLRITAQLIRTADSTHLWSQTYERPMSDVFEVQNEIAAAVVGQLKVKLLRQSPKAREANPEAYALLLQVRQLARQQTPESWERSITLAQQALALDPDYADAWYALAGIYLDQIAYELRPRKEGLRLLDGAIAKAVAINPDDAHNLLAWKAMWVDLDLASAARHFQRALVLEPTDTYTIHGAAVLAQNIGRLDTAIALNEYVIARDPVAAASFVNLARNYRCSGRFSQAIASLRTALDLAPAYMGAHFQLALALLLKGETQAALAEAQKEPRPVQRLLGLTVVYHTLGRKAESDGALATVIKEYGIDWAYNIAYALAWRNERDRAFEWLDKAAARYDPGLTEMVPEPLFANLHDDPRWLPFLRKLGMAPEQLAAIKLDVSVPN